MKALEARQCVVRAQERFLIFRLGFDVAVERSAPHRPASQSAFHDDRIPVAGSLILTGARRHLPITTIVAAVFST